MKRSLRDAFILTFVAVTGCLVISPEMARGAADPKIIQAVRAATPPVIDGKLDEPCWREAKPVSGFLTLGSGKPASLQTIGYVLYDDTCLYIGMKCLDPKVSSIVSKKRPHDDNLFSDDAVEIMLAPRPGSGDYYQLAANASGATFDCSRTRGGAGEDDSWNGEWTAATYIGQDYWSIEMAIPFYALNISPKVGSTWGINLCRDKQKPNELSSISSDGTFNDTAKFATLRGLNVDFQRYFFSMGAVESSFGYQDGEAQISHRIPITNETGKLKTVTIEVQSQRGDEEATVQTQTVTLRPHQRTLVALESIKAEAVTPGKLDVFMLSSKPSTRKVVVRDTQSNRIVALCKPEIPMTFRAIVASLEKTEVFKGDRLIANVSIPLSRQQLAAGRLRVDLFRSSTSNSLSRSVIFSPGNNVKVALDTVGLPWDSYTLEASFHDSDGKTLVATRQPVLILPTGKERVETLNNLVSELTNGKKRGALDKGSIEFLNPREGWVFVASAAKVGHTTRMGGNGSVRIFLDEGGAPVLIHDLYAPEKLEAMRYLSAGRHTIRVVRSGEASLEGLVVRAIPELVYCQFQADPHVAPYGPYDWSFLSRSVLPHVNTIVAGEDKTYERYAEQWAAQGRKWIVDTVAPGVGDYNLTDADKMYDFYASNPGFRNPSMAGVIVDEFGSQSATQYQDCALAVRRLAAEPKFKGHGFYPYCGPMYGSDAGRFFSQTVLDAGYAFAFERYFPEQPTEAAARDYLRYNLVEPARDWELNLPGSVKRMVVVLGYMSQPNESLNVNPGVDYKVWMDMQFYTMANDPVFKGLHGIQEYLSSYCDEENVRWAAQLYRHYGIEGRKDRLTRDPYLLPHLINCDFEKGTEGWKLTPADPGSMQVREMEGLSWLEGRYPRTSQGDTFLWMKRSGNRPNVFSQKIKSLQPGRLYSLKMFTADHQDLTSGKSEKKTNAVSVKVEGMDELPDRGFQFTAPSCYAHELGVFNVNHPAWINYHWRIYRATGTAGNLTIADWSNDKEPGGPVGQETICNFIEVQPYFAE